jgi:hypothetical protein
MKLKHVLVGAMAMTTLIFIGVGGAGDASTGDEIEFREASAHVGFEYETTKRSGIISDAGVYARDYDDDGWTDLLAIGGDQPVLFDNEGGEFSASEQLDGINRSVGAAIFLDYDADGDQDLILFRKESVPIVMHNDGGSFERTAGIFETKLTNPVGATAGDYDHDGCVDLFVIQNGDWTERLPKGTDSADVSPEADNGNPNILFDGMCGSFENTTTAAGISGSTWSLATTMVDLDRDGWPDIHVANDFNNDVVYWNDGDGTFTRTILSAETNRNAMATEIEDFDGDGRLDLFVTNIYLPTDINGSVAMVADRRANGNNLLLNRGGRRFEPAGERCGVSRGGWGWAAVGTDFDNDGDTDLFHSTLAFTARLGTGLLEARQRSPVYSYPALFERQSGSECSFSRANASAAGFEQTDGHGVAGADFDRDGDVDIAMAVTPGPTGDARYRLYENVGTSGGAVQVRIVDRHGTSTGGTRVTVQTPNGTQTRVDHSKSDYFSQDERVLHFGTATHSTVDVRVVWPDGSERRFEDVGTGQRLRVSRDGIERTIALDGSDSGSVLLARSGLVVLLASLVVVVTIALGYREYR